MPFQIVRNDITQMQVDAIVNTANPQPVIGFGTDAMVHAKAGAELLAARQKIGAIRRGDAAITPGFDLHAKYVIHTVGPVWVDGSQGEETLLRSCYDNSLKLAQEHNCQSVAFPLISTGNYGFPKDKALQIAIAAFSAFLMEQASVSPESVSKCGSQSPLPVFTGVGRPRGPRRFCVYPFPSV